MKNHLWYHYVDNVDLYVSCTDKCLFSVVSIWVVLSAVCGLFSL